MPSCTVPATATLVGFTAVGAFGQPHRRCYRTAPHRDPRHGL